ncbi:hypothetical protein [Crossiella cryophila]|uniref:Flp pilus assembly protein TadG n=1 Tax=Crossiella cryophila TaxID=43355 RepID=A0A7W7CGQ3_9PSEU|nr:hypothetical protein [Crossiella cryophila]MBB4679501.1 Flp pilus assembly protein TadG [Crossiella cryophila]
MNPAPRRRLDDRGVVSAMTAILGFALVLVLALVVDGTGKIRAYSRADALAAEAARAALTAVDTRSTPIQLDVPAAHTAARDYLARSGCPGTVEITSTRTVHVQVRCTEPARIGILGSHYTVTGTATAALDVGTGPTPAARRGR